MTTRQSRMYHGLESYFRSDSFKSILRRVYKPREEPVFKKTRVRRAALDKERKIAALFAATQQRENKVAELEATALSLVNLHKELLKPLEVPQCVRELAFNPDATYRKLLVIGVANKKQRTAEDPFWIACLDKPLGEYKEGKRLTGTWIYTSQKSKTYKIGDLPLDEDTVPRSSILGGILQLPKTPEECVLFREHVCRLFPWETSL